MTTSEPKEPGNSSADNVRAGSAGESASEDPYEAQAFEDWAEDARTLIVESPWTATLSALGVGLAAGILIGLLIGRD